MLVDIKNKKNMKNGVRGGTRGVLLSSVFCLLSFCLLTAGGGPRDRCCRAQLVLLPSGSSSGVLLPRRAQKNTRSRGGGADLTKIQPAGIRTKSGGARSIGTGKGPAGSGLSLGVAGVENGGRKSE